MYFYDLDFFLTKDKVESADVDSQTLDVVDGRTSPDGIDETDIDTLPDANVDKNVIRAKVIYLFIYLILFIFSVKCYIFYGNSVK